MIKKFKSLITLVILIGASPVFTGETLPTNFQVLQRLTGQALETQLAPIFKDRVVAVNLLAIDPHDSNNWFLENEIFQKLQSWGVDSIQLATAEKSILQENRSGGRSLEIKYRLNELMIEYTAQKSGFLSRVKKVRRSVCVDFYIQLLDSRTRLMIWSGSLQQANEDEVSLAALKKMETNLVWFTKSEIKIKSFFTQFIEPVVMMGAAGVIIYLFYSFRSR